MLTVKEKCIHSKHSQVPQPHGRYNDAGLWLQDKNYTLVVH